ncbi:transporter [Arthrobacter sp. MYb229]|uniref:SLC13 family permease n=1 Tax=unclassified Arthrobacter TaxID=235627 RepID=UPI000CFB6452|nr:MULTISPECIES: SLC13 family permease [unclassified Arthrobacter]PRA02447.1 transporter [Arthrobacter sp. MYb229]PRB50610.1 transporter [Arthrobacter sp. MYb216]
MSTRQRTTDTGFRYSTDAPQPAAAVGPAQRAPRRRWNHRRASGLLAAMLLAAFLVWCAFGAFGSAAGTATALPSQGALTLAVFAVAIWLWVFSPVGDTYVALGAALVLVLMGVLPEDVLFASLGEDTIWLLLAAFVIAAGITATGLATRAAAWIAVGARNPRQLMHLTTGALVATAFAVPSTSGRAALAIPVFMALAKVLAARPRVVLALSLLFPSVILLSAVASYLGAGAHLITSQILATSGYQDFSFAGWLLYGLPLAFVSSHLCAELVLWLFTRGSDRRQALEVSIGQLQEHSLVPLTGPLSVGQSRAALLVSAVVVLWCTEPLHHLHPAVVALLGSLLVASPGFGSVGLAKALKAVPWSMLIFMAATLTLGTALARTGAADWLARRVLGPVEGLGAAAPWVFTIVVVVVSAAAHLVIQSRSARSAVLIPLVVSLAPGVGVDAVAIAFASTAAAGFCHTLTSSAKPVNLFSDIEGVDSYQPADLLRLSAVLGPVMVALILVFSFWIWPAMGLPLFT